MKLNSIFVGACALGAVACAQVAESTPQVCTRMACESGVSILLGSGYITPVTVEAGPIDGSMQSRVCDSAVACTAGVFFTDLSAPELRVRVITGSDTIVRTVRPDYRITQPNGPDCPPTCRQAEVQFGDASPAGDPRSRR
ncbi:MAG: hypothetical protein ACREKM_02195 [Longimicrobiales bacterium]